MRDSRLSSKDSQINKRPSWNSKTKIVHEPVKVSEFPLHDKVKTKPPIPKIVKSPIKHGSEDSRQSSQKKIRGGTKMSKNDQPKLNSLNDHEQV